MTELLQCLRDSKYVAIMPAHRTLLSNADRVHLRPARQRYVRERPNDGRRVRTAREPQAIGRIDASLTRSVRRASGFVVCWACAAAWRCKSSGQPDGGEGLVMMQGSPPRGGV